MSKKNMYELWRDKELPGDWNERIADDRFTGEELAFHSGFMVHANIDQIRQENGIFDKWEDVETLESNRLYMADHESEGYKEKVIGYYIEKEKMFYGFCFFYNDNGKMVGGDNMSFNQEQIKTELKNIREVWNGDFEK